MPYLLGGATPVFPDLDSFSPREMAAKAETVIVNLLPVATDTVTGGSLMVGIVYWFIYIRKSTIAAVTGEGEAQP